MNKFRNSGFTLIEMLIVITIIGLLAAMIMRNFGDSAGVQARDAERVNAMSQIATIISSMQTKYHVPPMSGGGTKYPDECTGDEDKVLMDCFKKLRVASDDELMEMFNDPKEGVNVGNSNETFGYRYAANKNAFKLCAPLEDQGAFDKLNADIAGNLGTKDEDGAVNMYCLVKGPNVWDNVTGLKGILLNTTSNN